MSSVCRIAVCCFGIVAFGSLLAGCARNPATYPVEGRVVTEDGRPLQMGRVEFRSADHGVKARGQIDREGRFRLSTYEPDDGAVAGRHDVVIIQIVINDPRDRTVHNHGPMADPKYTQYETSGLSANIATNGSNEITLVVQAR